MNKQIIIDVVKYDVRDKLESDNIRIKCRYHIYEIVNKSSQTFINNSVNVISNVAHQIIVCPRRNFPYSPFDFFSGYFELIDVLFI